MLAVACNMACTLLASSCKATQPDHARIRIWDVKSGAEVRRARVVNRMGRTKLFVQFYDQLGALEGHKLSVVQLAFSPDDRWLVSTSRDRSWCIYQRTSSDAKPYVLAHSEVNAHDRIIW